LPKPTPAQRANADGIRREQTTRLAQWWLDRMTVASHQVHEKLVFFWHGHWATSVTKVKSPQLMLAQHRTLRQARDFAEMAHQMVVDPALVYWLDNYLNTKKAPNENLARELFELFLVGIGQYSERDIKEAGRALTGWDISLAAEKATFNLRRHDAGTKTILGRTGRFDAKTLVDLLLAQKAGPPFIASRLWFRYASSTQPIPERVRERMAAAFPAPELMLRTLFEEDAFRATEGSLVKQPIEWAVGAMRQLGLRTVNMPAKDFSAFNDYLAGMGQRPFSPPSVGGWPAGATWLTSAAAQYKIRAADLLAGFATGPGRGAATDAPSPSGLSAPTRLTPEDVAQMLCVDKWTDRTYALMRDVRDPRLLLTLGLVSPEYQVT
jgi:uncharacterized protein (DUF1800 family)